MTIWLRAWGEPAAAPPPEAGGGPWEAMVCNCRSRGWGVVRWGGEGEGEGGVAENIKPGRILEGEAPRAGRWRGYPVGRDSAYGSHGHVPRALTESRAESTK